MYHIKPDLRSQKSAARIYTALQHCLQRKPFQEISISDLQKASQVSRSTFYRHFDTPFDILCWKCDQYFEEMFAGYRPQPASASADPFHFVRYFFGYWQKHSAILEELYSAGQIEVLYQSHIKHLKQFFQSQKADPIEKEPYDYWAGIRCGILLGIFIPWIRKQKKESVEELVAILRHQMEEISRQKLFF